MSYSTKKLKTDSNVDHQAQYYRRIMLGTKIATLVAIGMGIAMLVTALGSLLFIWQSEVTTGTVVSQTSELGKSRRDTYIYYKSTVEFKAKDGKTYSLVTEESYSKGDQVQLRYNPNNPAEARVDSYYAMWWWTGIIAFMSMLPGLVVAAGLGSYWLTYGRKEKALQTASS